ncbi:MAG: DUF2188 domain-containing protein [Solirubrobacterales bacterium]|nr:DUF2188 domain-containing protein [Solirubrobacterales bacterium]
MKQSFDPTRLSLARQAAGLQKKDLAERVGLSPASITQYEAGNTLPPIPTVAQLALACGFPPGFLAYDGTSARPTEATTPYFRSLRSTRVFEREQAEALAILVWQVANALEEHVDLPEIAIPSMPVDEEEPLDQVEVRADALRKEWSVAEGPVLSVINLLENFGSICSRVSDASHRVDAFSQWIDGRPFVLLSDQKGDGARSRFDAAHELGHLVMHPDPDPGNKIMERQAHAFASAFLMPTSQVIDELPRKAPTRRDVPGLVDLRCRWGASIAAIYYRSKELGVISEAVHRRAMVRLTEFGFRKNEPGEVPIEEPSVLATALDLLEDAVGYGIGDLSAETNLGELQVGEICGIRIRPSVEQVPVFRIGNDNQNEEIQMAKGDIHTTKHGDGWANKVEGGQRASNTADTKKEAQQVGREMAQARGVEHVIHGKDGKIQDKNTYPRSRDPRKSPG